MPGGRPPRFRKFATVGGLLVAVAIMLTLVSYSVTLYRLYCQATGSLGTTQRLASLTDLPQAANQHVVVRFVTNTAPGLPWRFEPAQNSVRVRLGQQTLVFFTAENLSDEPIVGHATYNVTPEKVGKYFTKIQCFCFTEERLAPHQRVEMPVVFFVNPKMATDRGTSEVTEIDLSYTFFRSLKPAGAQDLGRFLAPAGSVEAGRKLFSTACAECHALDHDKIGPRLAGVVGRHAGSEAGFPYSPALAASGLTWTPANLDRWLAGPRTMVPGAHMPVALPDVESRRAIIAYLNTTGAAPSHPEQPEAAGKAGL